MYFETAFVRENKIFGWGRGKTIEESRLQALDRLTRNHKLSPLYVSMIHYSVEYKKTKKGENKIVKFYPTHI